jgi:hypothetical protein
MLPLVSESNTLAIQGNKYRPHRNHQESEGFCELPQHGHMKTPQPPTPTPRPKTPSDCTSWRDIII